MTYLYNTIFYTKLNDLKSTYINVTEEDSMRPSHIFCCSSSLKYLDNST